MRQLATGVGFDLILRLAQRRESSSPLSVTSAPIASARSLSTPEICSKVKAQTTVLASDDKPRGILAENLLHDVAFTDIALNLLQRELLQFRYVVLAVTSASAYGEDMIHLNLVGQSVYGLWRRSWHFVRIRGFFVNACLPLFCGPP